MSDINIPAPKTDGPTIFGYTPAQIRKALVAFAGFVSILLATAAAVGGIIPVGAAGIVQVILAVAAQYGVYKVPNAE